MIHRQADAPGPPSAVIQPPRGWSVCDLRELWAYRHFLVMSVYRDLKVRYTQTILGPFWAILQPLIQMVIFSVIFGMFARMPTNGVPYAMFYYSALVPWTFIATGLSGAIGSLHGNFTIVTKIYFPRMMLPIQAMVVGVFDFCMSFVILLGIALFFDYPPTPRVFLIPLFMIPAFLFAMGIGLLLSALSVQFRDIRYLATYATQLLMYLSPILYPREVLPEPIRNWAALNPIATMVDGSRWAFDAGTLAPPAFLAGSLGVAVALFLVGAIVFRRLERNLVDVL